MEPDYLIVGSGLSALAFGALMAESGRTVRILEAHDTAGGYGHTFSVGPYRFNAQLHYIWNAGEGRTVNRFLRKLGLTDEVTFARLDPDGYDHMRIPGYALDIPSDHAELARRLTVLFPAHAKGIAGFVDEVVRTDAELESLPHAWSDWPKVLRARGYRHLLRNRNASLADVFERHGLPPAARALLALQWPDFLLPPSRLSFFAWVMLFAGYARGAFYPKKHFHHVTESLVRRIEAKGGEVSLRRKVVAFLLDGRRVRGVRVEHVDEHGVGNGTFEELLARETICNMDPQRAARMIGFEHFSSGVRARLQYEYSPSSFVAYCAVRDVDLRQHGFGAFNVFHADDDDLEGIFEAMHHRGDYSRISFSMSTPTLVTDEPGDCPEGEQILELLTVADHSRFLDLKLDHPKGYRDKKQEIFDRMIDVIDRAYLPGIRDKLSVHVLGSPTTSERYAWAPAGNSYGSSMLPRSIWHDRLDHRTSLDRFHFCNASSGYAGFAGTIWTGCRLYEHLTGDRVVSGA